MLESEMEILNILSNNFALHLSILLLCSKDVSHMLCSEALVPFPGVIFSFFLS